MPWCVIGGAPALDASQIGSALPYESKSSAKIRSVRVMVCAYTVTLSTGSPGRVPSYSAPTCRDLASNALDAPKLSPGEPVAGVNRRISFHKPAVRTNGALDAACSSCASFHGNRACRAMNYRAPLCHAPVRDPHMMMPIPRKQTDTPIQSVAVGRPLSTTISHSSATPM